MDQQAILTKYEGVLILKKGIDVYGQVHIGATTVLFFANALVKSSPVWQSIICNSYLLMMIFTSLTSDYVKVDCF